MKFFFDTEFLESGPHDAIELVSIGIVAEDGREYYAVSNEFDSRDANAWVVANVFPHLGDGHSKPLSVIAKELVTFVGDEKPEFWAYYGAYDWVVLCQIFGTMMDLPKGWPMYCG